MENFIIIAIIVLAVGSASYYIWKEKKNGRKCIGCPAGGCGSCTCCGGHKEEDSKN